MILRTLTFCEAVRLALSGRTIVSYKGKRYTSKDIEPAKCGDNWFIVSNISDMTKIERELLWGVEGGI